MKDNVTIDQLLADDNRKEIAEKLLDNKITNVIIAFDDGDTLRWLTTMRRSQIIGVCQIIHNAVLEEQEEVKHE